MTYYSVVLQCWGCGYNVFVIWSSLGYGKDSESFTCQVEVEIQKIKKQKEVEYGVVMYDVDVFTYKKNKKIERTKQIDF